LRRAARSTLLAAALALAACANQTTVPDLPHDVPARWAGADAAPAPLDTWWQAFGDSALDQLIADAQHDNLTLQMAAQRLAAARHLHHRSRTDFWPNLNFRVYEETAPGGGTGFLEMGFDTTWELGLFGRAEGNKRVSVADVNSATIEAAAARITLSAEVARSYVEWCAARAHQHLAAAIATTRKRQADVAQKRLELHLGARSESEHAANEWRAATSEAEESAAPIGEAAAALSVLLGRTLAPADLPQSEAVPLLAGALGPQPPADLVRTRPEIRRAEQAVLRAAGELGIARADLYPKFSIVGTLISSTALTGDIDHPNKAVPLLGPAITIPIIDWHARRAVVGAREAALAAAVLAYREAVLEGVAEVDASLARYEAKSAALTHADEAVAAAQHALDTATASRRIGVIDDAELAGAELTREQAELLRVQARRDRALAFIALYKAFGGSLPPLVRAP
jgi:NodT family efflux transporter outer membrane factor (OMF) lipoprotein